MIMTLLYLLLAVIIIGIVIWAFRGLLPSIPMDPTFRIIAVAIVAIIIVLIVFYYVVLPLVHAIPG